MAENAALIRVFFLEYVCTNGDYRGSSITSGRHLYFSKEGCEAAGDVYSRLAEKNPSAAAQWSCIEEEIPLELAKVLLSQQ